MPTSRRTPLPETLRQAARDLIALMDPAHLRQAARLGILDDVLRLLRREPRACRTRDYQFGCGCRDCKARAAQAHELGYDHRTGKLNPRPAPPAPRQPWENGPASPTEVP